MAVLVDNTAHTILALSERDDADALQQLMLHRSRVLFDLLDAQSPDPARPGSNYPMLTVTNDALVELARDILLAAERLETLLDDAEQLTAQRYAAAARQRKQQGDHARLLALPPSGGVQ